MGPRHHPLEAALSESGLDGLDTFHPGQKATVLTPALRARILSATRKKPSDGSTHWSCRKLATALGASKDAVHRVWGLKPHRLSVTWPATIPSSKAKRPTLSACKRDGKTVTTKRFMVTSVGGKTMTVIVGDALTGSATVLVAVKQ